MKKTKLLILIFAPLFGFGQFIDSTNRWNDLEVLIPTCKSPECEGKFYITHSYTIGKDTLINENHYHIIIDTLYQQEGDNQASYEAKPGFIRELDKKIYYYSELKNEEALLYDFELQIDDIFEYEALTFKVTNIDSVDYEEQKRLKIKLENATDSIEWIEGIGAIQGFLYSDYYFFESKLLCFEQNDIREYTNDIGFDCIVTKITSLKEFDYSLLKIYPNPAMEVITIESENKIQEIMVCDMTGKLIYRTNPNRLKYSINLSQFERGIYLVKIDGITRKFLRE